MKKIKLILFIICGIIGLAVSLSFTRTMKAVLHDYLIEKYNNSRDEFNRIYFKKGFWINPYERYMQGSGLQKKFTFPIYFKPSVHNEKVTRMSFDLEMSPVNTGFQFKSICDDYLILLFNSTGKDSSGFRISAVNFIPSGWIVLSENGIRLIQPVNFTFQSKKQERVTASITPESMQLTIGNRSFVLPGNFNKTGVGFLLGTADTAMKNLEILYNEKIYKDLAPYDTTVDPLLLALVFLIPLLNWLCFSYVVARYFEFGAFKFMLSDFPVIFLFLFFKVNPHKTFCYATALVLFLIFFIRTIILAKFLYHLKDINDIRKKGFAILSVLTVAVFAGIYLLALFNADKLQPGETFIEKKEISLPILGILFLSTTSLFIYYERFSQLIRLAAISITILFFTAMPKYFRTDSYFSTADKLFKPNAMYYHYNGKAKTKPMSIIRPGYRRIFFAGGSATYGFPMDINGKAFPEQFEEILNRTGAKVDAFNIGMLGHTISSLRYSIEKNDLLNKYPIDLLVLYLGYNDASLYPKLYGFIDKTDWQSINFMNSSSFPRRIFRMIQFSPPISYLLLAKSMFIEPPTRPPKEAQLKSTARHTIKLPRVSVQEEGEHVAWFNRECKKRKILLIIVPELYNRTRSLAEALSQNPQQKAMVEAAKVHKIPVMDCYPKFNSLNNIYLYDPVHLNYEGNKKLAEILAEKLKPYLSKI